MGIWKKCWKVCFVLFKKIGKGWSFGLRLVWNWIVWCWSWVFFCRMFWKLMVVVYLFWRYRLFICNGRSWLSKMFLILIFCKLKKFLKWSVNNMVVFLIKWMNCLLFFGSCSFGWLNKKKYSFYILDFNWWELILYVFWILIFCV